IPTFREAQVGLWANDSPEDLASQAGFLRNPQRVWDWYDSRRNTVWTVNPNAGHQALARLEAYYQAEGKSFTLITQNIDHLHRRAGSENLIELHGNIFRYKCLENQHPYVMGCNQEEDKTHEGPENSSEQLDLECLKDNAIERPPRCPLCSSYIRPDVVWFGEMLDDKVLTAAYHAAETCKVMLIVGTSGVVYPATDIPMAAKRHAGYLVEINPEESALTPQTDVYLKGTSSHLLDALVESIVPQGFVGLDRVNDKKGGPYFG
ncbi:MAG: hypothetical protein K2X66_16030, partial [Cyanobacteria bacterium]|nr:hypothetical protein [Cyanobacteriota bacterium]